MIFVTVGSQLPFDRLVENMDEWAGLNRKHEVVIQSGESNTTLKSCHLKKYISPDEWEKYLQDADFVVSHAGMGTILKCIDNAKPLIVMPRKFKLGEVRNDHQIATASKLKYITNIYVVNSQHELFVAIEKILDVGFQKENFKSKKLTQLISELNSFACNVS